MLAADPIPVAPADGGDGGDPEDEVRVRGASQSAGFASRAREGDTPRETTDAASLAEALPGVRVRRLGADDGFATVSIRGSSSNQVAVLLAGVPLTGGSDPTLDLGSLPVWPGVQIRAYRTFSPASLGPGSLGGTLVLDPPRMAGRPRTETFVSYGSLGSMRMRAVDARPVARGDVTAALSASRSDDEFDVFVPDGRGGGRFVPRTNAGHAQASGLLSFAQPLAGGRGSSRLTLIAQARRQELPGTTLDPTPFDRLDTSRLVPALELVGPTENGGAWRVRAYARRDEQSVRSESATFALPHEGDAFIAAGSAAGFRGHVSDAVRLDVQLDAGAERYAPGRYAGDTPPGARRVTAGLGADLDVRLSRAVSASAAGRVDGWHDEEAASEGAGSSEVRPTGHVGGELKHGMVTVAAHGGATARPPAFVELFGNRGAFLANPDLRTETAVTADAGVRLAPRTGALRVEVAATSFATFAEDLITFVPVGAFGRARADNIGRARILGVEGELSLRFMGAEVRAVYTGLDARNLGEGACGVTVGVCERPRLPGRPAHDLVLDAAYERGPLRVRYGLDWASGIAADLQGTVEVPARVLQSAGVRFAVPGAPGLSVTGEVKNVFGVRVVEYAGVRGPALLPIGDAWAFPLPGRTALVSARYRME